MKIKKKEEKKYPLPEPIGFVEERKQIAEETKKIIKGEKKHRDRLQKKMVRVNTHLKCMLFEGLLGLVIVLFEYPAVQIPFIKTDIHNQISISGIVFAMLIASGFFGLPYYKHVKKVCAKGNNDKLGARKIDRAYTAIRIPIDVLYTFQLGPFLNALLANIGASPGDKTLLRIIGAISVLLTSSGAILSAIIKFRKLSAKDIAWAKEYNQKGKEELKQVEHDFNILKKIYQILSEQEEELKKQLAELEKEADELKDYESDTIKTVRRRWAMDAGMKQGNKNMDNTEEENE